MKPTRYLNKKERKKYSKLIANKIEALGVKDQITLQENQRLRRYLNEKGEPVLVHMRTAQNVLRNIVRRLRRVPKKEIDVFLATDIKKPEVQTEAASDEGIKI